VSTPAVYYYPLQEKVAPCSYDRLTREGLWVECDG